MLVIFHLVLVRNYTKIVLSILNHLLLLSPLFGFSRLDEEDVERLEGFNRFWPSGFVEGL